MGKIKKYNLYDVLFIAALATKPLYLKSSGSVQLSDVIYMLLFGLLVLRGKLALPSAKEKKWIYVFAFIWGYQVLVNLLWYSICSLQNNADNRMLWFNLFYLFNFFVSITIIQLYIKNGYRKLLELYLTGTILSIVICYIGVILNFSGKGRERGFFNNPNQLGYYAIIVMTVFVIYCHHIPRRLRIIIIALSLVLNILSLSKASIIGAAALLIVYTLVSSDERGTKRTISIILLIIIVTTLFYVVLFSNSGLFAGNYYIRTLRRRLIYITYENDSSLGTGRGYDRLKEIGLWIITGVGEGAYTRFVALSGKEIHSMFASIIVCYGIIGFSGYVWLFRKALFSNGHFLYNISCFSGILLYCVTHNGIRSTLLWSLIAMMLLRPYDEEIGKKQH